MKTGAREGAFLHGLRFTCRSRFKPGRVGRRATEAHPFIFSIVSTGFPKGSVLPLGQGVRGAAAPRFLRDCTEA